MTDTLFLLFVSLTTTLSIAFYHFGKIKGTKEGQQSGWLSGMHDAATMETALRNKINDLEETIKRFTVDQIPTTPAAPKKRGRTKIFKA